MKNGISFWYPEGWGKFYYTAVCQMNFEWSRGDEYHRDSWPEQGFYFAGPGATESDIRYRLAAKIMSSI